MPLLSAASSFSPQPMCITLTYHPRGPHHLSTVLAPPVVPGHCPSLVAFFTSLFWGCQTVEGLLPTSAQRNYRVFIMLGCCCSSYKAHSFMFSMYLQAHVWNLYGYWPPFFSFSSRISHSSSISPRKVRQCTAFTSCRDLKKGRLR